MQAPPAHLGGVVTGFFVLRVLFISNATQISPHNFPHSAHLGGVVKGVLVLRVLCGEEVQLPLSLHRHVGAQVDSRQLRGRGVGWGGVGSCGGGVGVSRCEGEGSLSCMDAVHYREVGVGGGGR